VVHTYSDHASVLKFITLGASAIWKFLFLFPVTADGGSLPIVCAYEDSAADENLQVSVGAISVILFCIVVHCWVNAGNGCVSRITCYQ
jgi:hypothetical protein